MAVGIIILCGSISRRIIECYKRNECHKQYMMSDVNTLSRCSDTEWRLNLSATHHVTQLQSLTQYRRVQAAISWYLRLGWEQLKMQPHSHRNIRTEREKESCMCCVFGGTRVCRVLTTIIAGFPLSSAPCTADDISTCTADDDYLRSSGSHDWRASSPVHDNCSPPVSIITSDCQCQTEWYNESWNEAARKFIAMWMRMTGEVEDYWCDSRATRIIDKKIESNSISALRSTAAAGTNLL